MVPTNCFLLLAIFVYSRWQERRELARFEMELRRGVGDPLLDRAPRAASGGLQRRIEPRLDAPSAETIPAAVAAAASRPADEFAPTIPLEAPRTESEADQDEPSAYALPDGWAEDPLLDFVIEHPTASASILRSCWPSSSLIAAAPWERSTPPVSCLPRSRSRSRWMPTSTRPM